MHACMRVCVYVASAYVYRTQVGAERSPRPLGSEDMAARSEPS